MLLKEQMGHLVDDGANCHGKKPKATYCRVVSNNLGLVSSESITQSPYADKNPSHFFQMQLIEQKDTPNVIGLAEL